VDAIVIDMDIVGFDMIFSSHSTFVWYFFCVCLTSFISCRAIGFVGRPSLLRVGILFVFLYWE